MLSSLLEKYNVPVPRYTSYPTVPYWKEQIEVSKWQDAFKISFNEHNEKEGISIYIHLPYCESLCTYCGCNKKISSVHTVELPYIQTLLKEWNMYLSLMPQRPILRALHLGGGTPTFFSSENLNLLVSTILATVDIHKDYEFSFEGHPNNTTQEHLQTLFDLGFRRVSFGVQDNDSKVQIAINRVQPIENLWKVVNLSREIGYTSINFDLIYGLPFQSLLSIENTIQQVIGLRPDRIAFYSYAHVPWTSKGQRLFDESNLPSAAQKLEMYLKGKNLLLAGGYSDIGMDHFALPNEDLYTAYQSGTLHRNFMGYTTQNSSVLIGLGVSSISDIGNAFSQNEKILDNYMASINQSRQLSVKKGYFLSEIDRSIRNYILDISCKSYTEIKAKDWVLFQSKILPALREMESDGLVNIENNCVSLTRLGKNFLRNVCSCFDLKLQDQSAQESSPIFSKAV